MSTTNHDRTGCKVARSLGQLTWNRRSSTFSATSYTHTNLLRPPANSMLPSALYVSEVKAAPDDRLPAERLQVGQSMASGRI
jgi:hypothetical protein